MSVLLAAGLDAVFAEPPARAHPVVWTGGYLDRVARVVPAAPRQRAVVAGGAAWLGGAAVALLAGRAADRRVLRGVALWPLLSARMLLTEVLAVETRAAREPRRRPGRAGPDRQPRHL